MLRDYARQHLISSATLQTRVAEECVESILGAAEIVADCFHRSGKVMICGNGGSAADAQHVAAEFVNRLNSDLDRPALPAIALTTDTSFITAYANDAGFDGIFERQILALGRPGDVLIAISTSGNSPNVIRAVLAARQQQVVSVGLLGEGGQLTGLVNHAVTVPSRDTQHVQEALLGIEHTICAIVEQVLFGANPSGIVAPDPPP